MGYDIQTKIQKGYIKLVASGRQTLKDNLAFMASVLEACVENKTGKALLDIRGLSGQPGTVADFELAGEAAKKARGIVEKAALLYNLESKEYTTFFVTAARNRGVNVQAFLEEPEAVRWLLES